MSTEAGTDAAMQAMLDSAPKDADSAEEQAPDAVTDATEADEGDGDTEDDAEGAEELGDKGKQALDRMKAKLKAERERRVAAEAKAAQALGEDDAARIEREALAKANTRIVRAEIKAAAAGKLADPADALTFLSVDDFEVDDDGDVDTDEIAEAIDELLRRKPYLAAQGGTRRPKPDRSQGAQGNGKTDTSQQFASVISSAL